MGILNNGIEIAATQYYVHNSYIPTYYYVYKFLQGWIADNIFRKDKSRVFMASPEYAFRRRFELTDMSSDFSTLDFSSLRFPFANYWPQNSGWTPDKRLAANTAAQVYLGIYEGATRIKSASSIIKIPVLLYFDREDDARLAYEILYFKTFNEHYYQTEVPYAGSSLHIPVNIEISNVIFNPEFKETDWLKRNRIFVIKADFDVRSFVIQSPAQPIYNQSVNQNGYMVDEAGNLILDDDGNPILYDDGRARYYLVDDVILNFGDMDVDFETYEGVENFPETGKPGVIYVDSKIDEENPGASPRTYRWNTTLEAYEYYYQKNIVADSIRVNGSLEESPIRVNYLRSVNIGATSFDVEWLIENPDDVDRIEIYQANKPTPTVITDMTITSYHADNLASKSQYDIYFNFYSKDGSIKRLWTSAITLQSASDIKSSEAPLDSLIGTTWQ